MSIPRPLLIALIGAFAVAAVLVYTRSQGAGTGGTSPAAAPASPPSAAPPKSATPSSTPKAHGSAPKSGQAAKPSSSTGKSAGKGSAAAGPLSVPPAVARALASHRVVLVLFWSPGGPEDRIAKRVFDHAKSRLPAGKVAAFEDSAAHVSRYSLIAGGVTRSPSIVVVDVKRKSRVVGGVVDEDTVLHLVQRAAKT